MAWKSLWAKSSPFHPLWRHLVDVGAVADRLWNVVFTRGEQARIASLLSTDRGEAGSLVCWLAAMHDVGKAIPGFQGHRSHEFWKLLEKEGLSCPDDAHRVPHGEASAAILQVRLIENGWDGLLALAAARCSGGHHGIPPRLSDPLSKAFLNVSDRSEWRKARHDLMSAVQAALEIAPPAPPKPSRADTSLAFLDIAGLISFADWIGSSELHFSTPAQSAKVPTDPFEYAAWSRRQAGQALENFGWRRLSPPLAACEYRSLFPKVFGDDSVQPRPLQERVAHILNQNPSTRLLLIEAPMGEGKTEAALYAARFWLERRQQKGVYVALPTQATSNAMYHRFREWIEALGYEVPYDLHILHSGLVKDKRYQEAIQATRKMELYDEVGKKPLPATAHEWFLQAKRGLLAPFGIGTIDQALLGVLRCKHHFVRLHGLAGKTIIFDEVHAYDVYTGSLLNRLIEYLGKLGSTVVLLSATLPSTRRKQLVASFTGFDETTGSTGYPRISHAPGSDSSGTEVSVQIGKPAMTVELDWLPDELEEAVKTFVGRLGDEGCAACIFNTVADCQRAYRIAKTLLPEDDVSILHSRFTAGERDKRERDLLNRFGKEGKPRPKRGLVLATQVIEQSLDLDFDLMASDLAPIDLLFQRVGRVHRHAGRQRGRHEKPVLMVRRPAAIDDGVPNFRGHSRIYDPKILFHTLTEIAGRKTLAIPDDMDELIGLVYDQERIDSVPESWREVYGAAVNTSRGDFKRRQAFASGKSISKPFDEEAMAEFWENTGAAASTSDYDDPSLHKDSRPLTRLGEDSLCVLCLFDIAGKLYLDEKGSKPADDRTPLHDFILNTAQISAVHVRAGGLEEIEITCKPLPAWKEKGILRYLPVLRFGSDRVCQLSQVAIVWDEEVGICYR